jgi:integration host factor subunit beta
MNRSELFLHLAEKSKKIAPHNVEEAVKVLLQAMASALHEGKRIEVRGFGSFNLYTRKPRVARNPKTGDLVNVPSRRAIRFKPGKTLKETVG